MRPDAPRPVRQEPREIVELRSLRTAHPELADAVDMQIELVTHQRRLQARTPTPVLTLSRTVVAARLEQGERLVDFEALPLDWSAARQADRATADILTVTTASTATITRSSPHSCATRNRSNAC